MKYKLLTGLAFTIVTVLLLIGAAHAQEPLDLTQSGAYPAYSKDPFAGADQKGPYLDHSCGGVKLQIVEEQDLTVMALATTHCPGSGRASKGRVYLVCWRVSFAEDRYYILSRDWTLAAVVTFGQPIPACPAI